MQLQIGTIAIAQKQRCEAMEVSLAKSKCPCMTYFQMAPLSLIRGKVGPA